VGVPLATGMSQCPEQIILFTFNIMKEQVYLEERMHALVQLIEHHKPHFVAIQENKVEHNQFFF